MKEQVCPAAWTLIREVTLETSSALASLDAVQLERLACLCRNLEGAETLPLEIPAAGRCAISRQIQTLQRILEVTKVNLTVMRHLGEVTEVTEYGTHSSLQLNGLG